MHASQRAVLSHSKQLELPTSSVQAQYRRACVISNNSKRKGPIGKVGLTRLIGILRKSRLMAVRDGHTSAVHRPVNTECASRVHPAQQHV